MDSGSADFWVGSEHCVSQGGGGEFFGQIIGCESDLFRVSGCGNHQFLGPQSSSTFVDTGVPFNVSYGTGQVAGTIVNDTLTMAGLVLQGHVFGTADVESVDFSS